eukprot:4104942-Alexandrium_andersonii.AAC.1
MASARSCDAAGELSFPAPRSTMWLSERGGWLLSLGIQQVAHGLRAVCRELCDEIGIHVSPHGYPVANASAARA